MEEEERKVQRETIVVLSPVNRKRDLILEDKNENSISEICEEANKRRRFYENPFLSLKEVQQWEQSLEGHW